MAHSQLLKPASCLVMQRPSHFIVPTPLDWAEWLQDISKGEFLMKYLSIC